MTRRSRTLKASRLWRLVLVPLPFLIALPFLLKPSFSLVDDGVSLDVAKRMDANDMRVKDKETGERYSRFWYIEDESGRVRPAYWWWLWLNYKLYGTSPTAWFLGLALSLVVLLQIIYQLASRATGSVLAGVLAGGLVAAFYPYSAVFARLGLGETPQVLLLGASLLCMGQVYALGPRIAKRDVPLCIALFAAAVVMLAVAYFVKETTLAMLPTSVVMALALWRRRSDGLSKALLIGYAAASLAAAAALLVHVWPLMGSGRYSTLYFFRASPGAQWSTVEKVGKSLGLLVQYLGLVRDAWLALPVLGLASLAVRLVRAWRGEGLRDEQRWPLVWLTYAAASVLLLAPWGGSDRVVARYLLPFTMFGALVIGPEIAWLLTATHRALAERDKAEGKLAALCVVLRVVLVSLVALLGVVGVMNLALACTESAKMHARQTADANLVRLIAAQAPKDEPVFAKLLVGDEEEIRYGIVLHVRLICGREDYGFRSIRYIGEADRETVPANYRELVGYPEAGQWIVYPYGRYRYELGGEIARVFLLLKPKQAYAVTTKGWQPQPDLDSLERAMKQAGYGWIVLVPSVGASQIEMPEERAP